MDVKSELYLPLKVYVLKFDTSCRSKSQISTKYYLLICIFHVKIVEENQRKYDTKAYQFNHLLELKKPVKLFFTGFLDLIGEFTLHLYRFPYQKIPF
jgi:hypothetical protein